MTGVPIVGTTRIGSAGFEPMFCTDTRKAVAMGMTYRRTSTTRPIPAHQYRTPRMRIAVSPNGFSEATSA